jgi:hypothetical protein
MPPPPPPHQDLKSHTHGQRKSSASSIISQTSLVQRIKRKSLPQNGVPLQDDGSQQGSNSDRRFSFEHVSRETSASPKSLHGHHKSVDSARRPEQRASHITVASNSSGSQSSSQGDRRSSSYQHLGVPRSTLARPASAYTLGSDVSSRGRASPRLAVDQASPKTNARGVSASRRSPENRPVSYLDLLNNVPYAQQIAPSPNLENAKLRGSVGSNASLLNIRKTLEMYRANVKKTNDLGIQYEFAIFMIQLSRDPSALSSAEDPSPNGSEQSHE